MEFPPEHYFETSTQRMRQAWYLFHQDASFALAIYVAGLAVECLLRAHKGRRNQTFDEKHDLLKLFHSSGLLRIDRDALHARNWTDAEIDTHLKSLDVAIHDVFRIWSNSHRFASEERLRSHLKRVTGYRRIKGDYLKHQARQLLDSAQMLMHLGTVQWQL